MTAEEKRRRATEYMRRWRVKRGPVPSTPEQREAARERGSRWRARHPGKRTPYDPTYPQRYPWARALGAQQARAKKRGFPFVLKVVDVRAVWTGRCAVTGLPFDTRVGLGVGPRPFSPSLDRIVPARGYVPGNIRFVLQCVNAFRGRMNDRLMARVAQKIVASGTLSLRGSQADKAQAPA